MGCLENIFKIIWNSTITHQEDRPPFQQRVWFH